MVEATHRQARRMEAPRAVALCMNFGGALDFQRGRWDQAEASLREAVSLYQELQSASGEALSLQRLAVLLTARGALDEAMAVFEDGVLVAERASMRSHCLTRLYASMARNRLAAVDVEGASGFLEDGERTAERHGHCVTCNALLLPEAVRVQVARGRLDDAEAAARTLEETAERSGSRAWTAMARHARARVRAARGDADQAVAAFEEAQAAYVKAGNRYEAARCLLGAADVLEGASQPAEAERRRREAGDALAAIGAPGVER